MKQLFLMILFTAITVTQDTNDSKYLPGDHELFFSSTAYTMKQGESYLTDYELAFLNYNYSLTNSTHIGAFGLMLLRDFSIGLKQKIFEMKNLIAISSSTVFFTRESSFYFGGTVSLGSIRNNLNFSYGKFTKLIPSFYSVGGQISFSKSASFLMEYNSSANFFKEFIDKNNFVKYLEFSSIVSAGIRLRTKTSAWEFGILHMLKAEKKGFYPLIKATFVL
jgi:hypothetical protein